MTKQEILNLIDTTIKPNNKKAISAQSLQNVLREMAEASGEESGSPEDAGLATLMTEVTYDELVTLIVNGSLIPGMKYCITDYKTVVNQEGVMSLGSVFEIVVTAIAVNALSEDAIANCNGWVRIKYSLINDVSRFKWASIGEGLILDYHGMLLGANKTEITVEQDGITYYEWDAFGFPVYTQSSSPSINDAVYIDLSYLDETAIVKELTTGEKGKGVIYEMEDAFGNQCPYDFYNIQFKVYDYFGTPSFIKKDGADEMWCHTFRDSDGGGDFSTNMPNIETTAYPYTFCKKMYNNKVLYYPYTLHPIVLNTVEEFNIVDPEVGPIYFYQYMYDNTIIDCDNLFITLSSNVKVSNCLNLSTNHNYDNFINNLEIDTIKSENDVYFLENLETSDNYTTHIAKNSQGEVKIWNPADLIA